MISVPKHSQWLRLAGLLLVLPLSSCCEDRVETYEDAVQQINQHRIQLRRLTIQRSVVEKKLLMQRRVANTTPNPAEYRRQAQIEHDQQAAELNQKLAEERKNLRLSEGTLASMRSGS